MPRIIAGLMGSSVAGGSTATTSPGQLRQILNICRSHGILEVDTARVYGSGQSEEAVGQVGDAAQDFAVHTKAPGFMPGSLAPSKVMSNCEASLAALKRDCIDLYYFHGPDRQTPLQDSCRAINELHAQGKVKTFGVSNLRVDEVQEVVDICVQNDWLRPSVYQGGYNAISRTAETALFPTLRKHNIAFYAFSPLGGGFFTRTKEELLTPVAGSRMDAMPVFKSIYVNEDSLPLHDKLTAACTQHQISLHEATLRWTMHHSALQAEDAIILGASTVSQMQTNICACEKGPLPASLVEIYREGWDEYSATGRASKYSV